MREQWLPVKVIYTIKRISNNYFSVHKCEVCHKEFPFKSKLTQHLKSRTHLQFASFIENPRSIEDIENHSGEYDYIDDGENEQFNDRDTVNYDDNTSTNDDDADYNINDDNETHFISKVLILFASNKFCLSKVILLML